MLEAPVQITAMYVSVVLGRVCSQTLHSFRKSTSFSSSRQRITDGTQQCVCSAIDSRHWNCATMFSTFTRSGLQLHICAPFCVARNDRHELCRESPVEGFW